MPDDRVAGADQRAQLVAVLRADVEEQILVVDRLALLAAAQLLQACHHDAGQRPVPREHVDALADHHGRVEAADRAHGGEAVVAEMRDDDADLVDVAHDRERRASRRARHAHPRAAEDVGRDLADGRGGLSPHGGDGLLLPRGTGRRQQAFEQLGKGHGRGTLAVTSGARCRLARENQAAQGRRERPE